jgi:hypothetical protein
LHYTCIQFREPCTKLKLQAGAENDKAMDKKMTKIINAGAL